MTATHGFSIAGVVTAHAHRLDDPPAITAEEVADQFDLDLRGDHDDARSYAWLAERGAIAAWEAGR